MTTESKLETYINNLSYLMGAYSDRFSPEIKKEFANMMRDAANMIDTNIYDEDIAKQSLALAFQMGFELIVKTEMEKRKHDKGDNK